ncbi:hypothetical protein [uncultured Tenacibaculum sp.]|uniref:hypothetical protein n=1 Tax=uncultured Tenacibaculum sp. TaxID=174713 RepID=UPI002618A76D|nr:hypothetical protein [uncultured Tenacibaculum sp.]
MEIKDIISVISLLGLGGVLGAWIRYLLDKRKDTYVKIQSINENKYRSTLIFMRCLLDPSSVNQFEIHDPNFKKNNNKEIIKYSKQKLKEFYYNSLLYASDEVLIGIKNFIDEPSEENFLKSALSMRKDLWNKSSKKQIKELML